MRTVQELVAEWSVWLVGDSPEAFFEKLTLEEAKALWDEFGRRGDEIVRAEKAEESRDELLEAVIEAQKHLIGIDEELIAGLSALGDLLDRIFVEEGEG